MAAAIGLAKTATEVFLGVGTVSIDNLTFQLHYRWSVTLFIVCSVLVQTSQFFGDPVQCETGEDSVDDDVLNSFCWMYSSFDMPPKFSGPCIRKGKYTSSHLYNTYYQWVPIFLAIQAGLFYIPRCLWLMLEGGLMSYIVKGTTGRFIEDTEDKIAKMLKHFQEQIHNKFNSYAFGFFGCELLNCCFSILSVYLTHKFLLNQYFDYGVEVYKYYRTVPEERSNMSDPFCQVFPKMAACHYHRYGMGGREDDRHAICILGLNMINDKVFVLIWLWHCFIVFMGVIRLLTRSPQLVSSEVRYFLMKFKMQKYFKNNAHIKCIKHYLTNCSIGDWYVLYQMSKNLNQRFFAEYLTVLAMTIDPDPTVENEEAEIFITDEELERHRNGHWSNKTSRKGSIMCSSSEESLANHKRNLLNCDDEMDASLDQNQGTSTSGGLDSKQRMLIKKGKMAVAANRKINKAELAIKRMRRR